MWFQIPESKWYSDSLSKLLPTDGLDSGIWDFSREQIKKEWHKKKDCKSDTSAFDPAQRYEPERSAQSINSRNIALGMEYSLDIGSITFDPMVVELMLSIRGHMRVREGSKYGHFPTQLLYAISDPRIQVIFG